MIFVTRRKVAFQWETWALRVCGWWEPHLIDICTPIPFDVCTHWALSEHYRNGMLWGWEHYRDKKAQLRELCLVGLMSERVIELGKSKGENMLRCHPTGLDIPREGTGSGKSSRVMRSTVCFKKLYPPIEHKSLHKHMTLRIISLSGLPVPISYRGHLLPGHWCWPTGFT